MRSWGWPNFPNTAYRLNRNSPQANGLLAWWPTIGSPSNQLIEYVRGNNAVITGATLTRDARQGTELSFTATAGQGAVFAGIQLVVPFTISYWVKVGSDFSGGWRDILDPGADIGPQFHSSQLDYYYFTGRSAMMSYTFTAGSLVHVVHSCPGHIVHYANGRFDSQHTPVESLTRTWVRWGTYNEYGFSMGLSDMRFYNRALSAQEVWQMYYDKWDLYEPIVQKWVIGFTSSSGNTIVSPNNLSTIASSSNPTSVLGSIVYNPNILNAVVNTNSGTYVLGSITYNPNNTFSVVSSISPNAILGNITYNPSLVNSVISITDGNIVLGNILYNPTNGNIITNITNPIVEQSSISYSPSLSSAVISSSNGTVELGSITYTPNTNSIVVNVTNPNLVLGSISINPSLIKAILSSTNPTINTGGNIVITPDIINSVLSTTNPDNIILGSLSIQPNIINSVLSSIIENIELGNITYNPSNIDIKISSSIDDILLGGIVISPNSLHTILSSSNPIINLSSIIITPNQLNVIAETANPLVNVINLSNVANVNVTDKLEYLLYIYDKQDVSVIITDTVSQ